MSIFERAAAFMARNARPVDWARFRYHFMEGTKQNVLDALAAYQNEDGGFGHALEADSWNPDSCPIQTWCATEILREVDAVDPAQPIVQGIVRYLTGGAHFRDGRWLAEVPSNDEHPHAPWWSYGDNVWEEWGYNPTAALSGFLLRVTLPGSAAYCLAEGLAKDAVDSLLAPGRAYDMNELPCYIRLYEDIAAENLFSDMLPALREACADAVAAVVTRDTALWSQYAAKPSQFLLSCDHFAYAGVADLAEFEVDWIIKTQRDDGAWDIPWTWTGYPDAWAVSKRWWQGNGVILNLRYLRGFGKL